MARLSAAAFAAAWFAIAAGAPRADADCLDERVPLDLSVGGTPFAALDVGGQRGLFLIDTGATRSAVDARRYRLAPGADAVLDARLCGAAPATFRAEEMSEYRAPPGGQAGRIGMDMLGPLRLEIAAGGPSPSLTLSSTPFDRNALAAAGFVEIDRARDAGAVTPTVGLAIGAVTFPAQLDTGFNDSVTPGVVQGNAALLGALREAGVAMAPAPGAATFGCSGLRTYPRWRIETAELALIGTNGARVAAYSLPLIEVKDDAACGGIAASSTPFAQIGASWLGRWRNVAIDGPSGAVWISDPAGR